MTAINTQPIKAGIAELVTARNRRKARRTRWFAIAWGFVLASAIITLSRLFFTHG